jgi:hypothetical protein
MQEHGRAISSDRTYRTVLLNRRTGSADRQWQQPAGPRQGRCCDYSEQWLTVLPLSQTAEPSTAVIPSDAGTPLASHGRLVGSVQAVRRPGGAASSGARLTCSLKGTVLWYYGTRHGSGHIGLSAFSRRTAVPSV